MALPDSVKRVPGTPIVVADTTDHSPVGNNNLGARTDQIDCTDLVAGLARQSTILDFGVNLDLEYVLAACIEWENNPEVAAGETVDFYMGFSHSATVGLPAGLGVTDAAYAGYSAGSLADSLKQLVHIGTMSQDNVIDTDEAQIDTAIGTFIPKDRYGVLVVVNNAAAAAFHSDMIETSFRITPIGYQTQD